MAISVNVIKEEFIFFFFCYRIARSIDHFRRKIDEIARRMKNLMRGIWRKRRTKRITQQNDNRYVVLVVGGASELT